MSSSSSSSSWPTPSLFASSKWWLNLSVSMLVTPSKDDTDPVFPRVNLMDSLLACAFSRCLPAPCTPNISGNTVNVVLLAVGGSPVSVSLLPINVSVFFDGSVLLVGDALFLPRLLLLFTPGIDRLSLNFCCVDSLLILMSRV